MLKKIKKLKINTAAIYLGILFLAVLFFPVGKTFSASTGTLVIKTNPTLNTAAYLDGNPVPIINGTSGNLTVNEGLHYVIFDKVSGYTTPQPDANIANDDPGNLDPSPTDANQGRRIYVKAGQTNTMDVTYRRESYLKQIGRTTAETLLFTPSPTKTSRRWGLLRGTAEISADGGTNWQKSMAEVLYVGTLPQAFIDKYSADGYRFLAAGAETQYYMDFFVVDTPNLTYDATITDEISVNPVADAAKITVTGAGFLTTSIDCPAVNMGVIGTNISPYTAASKTITYNLKGLTRGCTFRVWLKIKSADDITNNIIISDKVTIITSDGATAEDTYQSMVIPPFAKENVGGDIYARGNRLNLGPLGGGLYVIGSGGNVEAVSAQNWILEGYKIRAKSTTDFDPDTCAAGSSCKAMKDNVDRLKLNPTKLVSGAITSFNFGATVPEGEVWYKSGGACPLVISSAADIPIKNKGTLLVENCDVVINRNITKFDGNAILGLIVHNGNVTIKKDVRRVDALFYIYSDKGLAGQKGSFITESNSPNYDQYQLVINGLVISSGYSFNDPVLGWIRKDAFKLNRNYFGNLMDPNIDFSNPANLEPAELFLYDGRVVSSPPPGFGGGVIRE